MWLRTITISVVALLGVVACKGDRDGRKGEDTLAVPAGAVDTNPPAIESSGATVKAGAPGAGTAASGAPKAEGVDSPITRKIRKEDSARTAPDTARKPR
jgi:hypothetical protein